MMRRYLAQWPDEVHRFFLMLDLIAHGAAGHGPVHLVLTSAAEIGFGWNGDEPVWIRAALPLLVCFRAYPTFSECYFLRPGSSGVPDSDGYLFWDCSFLTHSAYSGTP